MICGERSFTKVKIIPCLTIGYSYIVLIYLIIDVKIRQIDIMGLVLQTNFQSESLLKEISKEIFF